MGSRYLRLLGVLVLLLLPVATYRDSIAERDTSLTFFIGRAVVMATLGFGLYRRNVWAVRLIYVFGWGMLFLTILGFVWFRYPDIESLSWRWPILLSFCLAAITIFIPATELTGRSRSKASEERIRETGNPYQAPSAEIEQEP